MIKLNLDKKHFVRLPRGVNALAVTAVAAVFLFSACGRERDRSGYVGEYASGYEACSSTITQDYFNLDARLAKAEGRFLPIAEVQELEKAVNTFELTHPDTACVTLTQKATDPSIQERTLIDGKKEIEKWRGEIDVLKIRSTTELPPPPIAESTAPLPVDKAPNL